MFMSCFDIVLDSIMCFAEAQTQGNTFIHHNSAAIPSVFVS
jgi:hypothetical protein